MKKKLAVFTLISLLTIAIGACAIKGTPKKNTPDNPTPSDPSTPDDPVGPEDPDDPVDPVDPDDPIDPGEKVITIQDETILHAFNWSMNNIKNSLDDIKNAGFNTIQLSPMQPQKDYYNGDWKSQWWKLYQPLGFQVANGNNQNVLGTKDQLTSLCSTAKQKGMKIIVDVVTNHLAGGDKNSLNGGVSGYENEIYSKGLIHHTNKDANDNDVQSIVQGHIGNYPDLMTEDNRVQNRVLSMLKEYVDCGISGFRFDAAKHIETPDDGAYASNYWPTVINGVTEYATNKGKDKPYIYGEILYQCGKGRSYSSYTKYMSVVDSSQGSDVLDAVKNSNISKISTTYNSGVNADHLVLWAESHDTYSNDGSGNTRGIDQSIIDKAYVIQASRKDATSLYLARPGGNIGDIGSTAYKSNIISAINKFHSRYAKEGEAITKNNGIFVNVRGNANKGAAIVNVNSSSSSATVSVNLPDGSYTDLITNKNYTVSNKSVAVNFTSGACILVPDGSNLPSVSLTPQATVFNGTTKVHVDINGATSSYYQINGGSHISITGSQDITIGEGLSSGDVTIKVTASNDAGSNSASVTLLKTTLASSKLIIRNVKDLQTYTYLIWSWSNNMDGKFYDPSIDGNMFGYTFPNSNYIVVKFNKGTTASSAEWKDKKSQTNDLTFQNQVIDFNDLGL